MAKIKQKIRILMEMEVPCDFNVLMIENDFMGLDQELSDRHIQDFRDPENDDLVTKKLEFTKIYT